MRIGHCNYCEKDDVKLAEAGRCQPCKTNTTRKNALSQRRYGVGDHQIEQVKLSSKWLKVSISR